MIIYCFSNQLNLLYLSIMYQYDILFTFFVLKNRNFINVLTFFLANWDFLVYICMHILEFKIYISTVFNHKKK